MKSKKKPSQEKSRWKADYEYKTDYNDHFETPMIAYRDILPLLDGIQPNRTQHTLYDPYYCNGRTSILLRELGFDDVIHHKRDFYKDVEQGTIPLHDTLVTNPPYSDDHKELCLQICLKQLLHQKRSCFVLMPNYIAARSYYRTLLGDALDNVVYILPSEPYEYAHPEGTGKEIPPFESIWYCFVGRDRIKNLVAQWDQYDWDRPESSRPKLVQSLPQLEQLGAIPTTKRPNPRQRKKRRRAAMTKESSPPSTTRITQPSRNSSAAPSSYGNNFKSKEAPHKKQQNSHKKNKSKYRDGEGRRIKKRF
jgi:hypothetical protein